MVEHRFRESIEFESASPSSILSSIPLYPGQRVLVVWKHDEYLNINRAIGYIMVDKISQATKVGGNLGVPISESGIMKRLP